MLVEGLVAAWAAMVVVASGGWRGLAILRPRQPRSSIARAGSDLSESNHGRRKLWADCSDLSCHYLCQGR
jgi:hypothetical protein